MATEIYKRDRNPCALPGPADGDIAQAVRAALEADVLISDEQILVTVEDGWVTLEGSVAYWEDRRWIEDCVRGLPGVRGLTLNLTIMSPAPKTQEIEYGMEHALDAYDSRMEPSR